MRRVVIQSRTPEARIPVVRTPTRQCDKKGCNALTKAGKSFCTEHILYVARAKDLRVRLDGVENEIERVRLKGTKAVNLDGLVVEEILVGIAHQGQVTWRRLCISHVAFFNSVKERTTNYYCERLRKEGLVKVTRNKRSNVVVSLTPKGLCRAQRGGIK